MAYEELDKHRACWADVFDGFPKISAFLKRIEVWLIYLLPSTFLWQLFSNHKLEDSLRLKDDTYCSLDLESNVVFSRLCQRSRPTWSQTSSSSVPYLDHLLLLIREETSLRRRLHSIPFSAVKFSNKDTQRRRKFTVHRVVFRLEYRAV